MASTLLRRVHAPSQLGAGAHRIRSQPRRGHRGGRALVRRARRAPAHRRRADREAPRRGTGLARLDGRSPHGGAHEGAGRGRLRRCGPHRAPAERGPAGTGRSRHAGSGREDPGLGAEAGFRRDHRSRRPRRARARRDRRRPGDDLRHRHAARIPAARARDRDPARVGVLGLPQRREPGGAPGRDRQRGRPRHVRKARLHRALPLLVPDSRNGPLRRPRPSPGSPSSPRRPRWP